MSGDSHAAGPRRGTAVEAAAT